MEKHAPIEKAEARFLQHEQDLLAVTPLRAGNHSQDINHFSAVAVVLALLLPLVALAIVSSPLGRMFIAVMVALAEAAVIVSTDLVSLMPIREWITCATVWVPAFRLALRKLTTRTGTLQFWLLSLA